jgi:tRNA(Arg) A34 adenosine deaminase TadA
MNQDHERFMREALREAVISRDLGNMAVGAVIVRDGVILARGRNEAGSSFDSSAHAEVSAIRNLTRECRQPIPGMQADSGPYAGASLYSTLEPCPMCCWLTCITGLSAIVVGARHADLEIPFGEYTIEKLIALTGRRIRLVTGVLTAECADVCRSGPFQPGPR